MAETWKDSEIDACVRTYLWMRDVEVEGYTPKKTRVREALLAGPMSNRSHGSIEYRFQNISAVLDQHGEDWVKGYKPAKNVGSETASKIEEFIDAYASNRHARRMNWLVNALPADLIRQSASELASGKDFIYPESTDYDVVADGKTLPPKKVIGNAGLLYYGAPLFSGNFSAGHGSRCFKRIEEAGYAIQEKVPPDLTDPETLSFRHQVKKYKPSDFKTPPQGKKKPSKKDSSSSSYERDPKVVSFVEWRANGICELCGQPAPFNRPDGTPYLEVHHIIPLSEDGADSAKNAAALCPNCHRACHSGADTKACQSYLQKTIIESPDEAPWIAEDSQNILYVEHDLSLMWLRPKPDASFKEQSAYALTIDGAHYAEQVWGEDMYDAQSKHRIDAVINHRVNDYSFEDLRGLIFVIQRAIKWEESHHLPAALDHVFRLICEKWDEEAAEHLPQVQAACRCMFSPPPFIAT